MLQPSYTPISTILLDLAAILADTTLPEEIYILSAAMEQPEWVSTGYRLDPHEDGHLLRLGLPGNPTTELIVAHPRLPNFSFVVGASDFGGRPTLDILIPDGDQPAYLELGALQCRLRFESSWLRPLDGSPYAELIYDGGLRLYRDWHLSFRGEGFSFPPCEVADTGFVIEFAGVNLDFSTKSALPGVAELGLGEDFQGIYARAGRITMLPQSVFGDTPGLQVAMRDAAIGSSGLTCTVEQLFPITYDAGQIDPSSGMVGYLFDEAWQIALIGVTLKIFKNMPTGFQIRGALRLPPLQTIVETSFGLQATPGHGYQTTMGISLVEAREFPLGPGTLTIETLSLHGTLGTDRFSIAGRGSGHLLLPNFDIAVAQAQIQLSHNPGEDRFSLALTGVEFGELGKVERALLRQQTTRGQNGGEESHAFWLETTLAWSDMRAKLNLDELPEQFPLPPDDAMISAKLHWKNGSWALSFSAQVTDVHALWSFLPAPFLPEVREMTFSFQTTHQESDGSFSGEVSLDFVFRLPPLPVAAPGMELVAVTAGDAEGWIGATIGGALATDEEGSASLQAAIHNAVTVEINLPGLPQQMAPIHLSLTAIDLYFGLHGGVHGGIDSDAISGSFALRGDLLLRPILPGDSLLPLPPIMAGHMEKLFQSLKIAPFAGTVSILVAVQGNQTALALEGTFANAGIELDLFDLLATVAQGAPVPAGIDNPVNAIDLDIDIGFALRKLAIHLGALEDSSTDDSSFGFAFEIDLTLLDQPPIPIKFALSDQQFDLGIAEMIIPLSIPRFPFRREDMADLTGADGLWDYAFWEEGRPANLSQIDVAHLDLAEPLLPQIEMQLSTDHLVLTEQVIDELLALISTAKATVEQRVDLLATAGQPNAEAGDPNRRFYLESKVLPNLNQEALVYAGKKFMIQSVFAVYNALTANHAQFQTYFNVYQQIMDNTIGLVYADTDLSLVFENLRFVLPFHNPSDVRVEGGAKLRGFDPDSPLAPLNDMSFAAGLSAEFIYLAVEGSQNLIELPPWEGRYAGVAVGLDHLRIGYGYSKNSLAISFAGQLNLPEQLVMDADTSQEIGAGLRLPRESRVAFKLDLIPIVLGEVDFLLPLFKFDVDLRKAGAPGIADPRSCEPYWDGLQLHIPGIFQTAFKRMQFAPFYGPLPAPNYSYNYDIVFGSGEARMAYVCDDFQFISPVITGSVPIPIPFIADGTPYFDNQCVHLRLAGFGLNLNLQRPLPSMSPLAIFEILGLMSDPMMPIDPRGSLAETIRVTLQHAQISLPPAVVHMFPELGTIVDREVNYHLNLGTVIEVTQRISQYLVEVQELMQAHVASQLPTGNTRRAQSQANWADITAITEQLAAKAPPITAGEIIALLPPDLRQIELNGSFIGFDASAIFLLLTPDELPAEFAKRTQSGFTTIAPTFPADPAAIEPLDRSQLERYQPNLPAHIAPTHLPADPQHNLLQAEVFRTFKAGDLEDLSNAQPETATTAIVVGAQVRVFDRQSYAFLGYMYADGHFGFMSAVDLQPLVVTVAGISVGLPLAVQGRLSLQGLARGAESYARVTAAVRAEWDAIPGVVRLVVGRQSRLTAPATFTLDSRGQFAANGQARLSLFDGSATVDGSVDISHTHCHVEGKLHFQTSAQLFGQPLLVLALTSRGRIGPGPTFALHGHGSLTIADNTIADIQGHVSERGAAIEAQIDTDGWRFGNLPIGALRMGLRGQIDISQRHWPSFLLEGEAYLRLFGSARSAQRLEIEGRGGIYTDAEALATYIEGRLYWQGRDWLAGRVSLHSENGLQIAGQTQFGLILSPEKIGNVEVASLVFRINLGGMVTIGQDGSFDCDLALDWDLGVNLPGNEEQTLPLAANAIRIQGSLNRPLELIDLRGFKLLPLQQFDLALPVPRIKGKGSPALRIGAKNGKIALNAPGLGTLYFDEREFVTGLSGGRLPSMSGGQLPALEGGRLPSLTGGKLPSLSRGRLPGLSINFLTSGFAFDKGTLPSLTKGSFPELDPGEAPSFEEGRFPSLDRGAFPTAAKSKLAFPAYGARVALDRNSDVAAFYGEYEVDWQNERISVDLSTFASSPIKFGIDKGSHQFYIMLGDKKYALTGNEM